MRKLEFEKRSAIELDAYRMRGAQEQDYLELISEDADLYEGGKLLANYRVMDWDTTDVVAALRKMKYDTDVRVGGMPATFKTIGWMGRSTLRRDYCTATKLAREYPAEHNLVCRQIERICGVYKANNPELYAKHLEQAEKVLPEYRLYGTPFTSGIINHNSPLKYHFDGGNFKGAWSCMMGFKGLVKGGHLALPEFGLGFEIADNSLFCFDGQGILHGVTPITYLAETSYRFTVVFYSLVNMWSCQPLELELDRIRKRKTNIERKRAGVVK